MPHSATPRQAPRRAAALALPWALACLCALPPSPAHADDGAAHADGGDTLGAQLRRHPYARVEAQRLTLSGDGWEAQAVSLLIPLASGGALEVYAERAELQGGRLRLEGARLERPQAPQRLSAARLELGEDGSLRGQGLRAAWPDGWGGEPAELWADDFEEHPDRWALRGVRVRPLGHAGALALEADEAALRWEAGRWRLESPGVARASLGEWPVGVAQGASLDARSWGLLAPSVGYSPEDGGVWEQGFFAPLSPSLDLTPWALGRTSGLVGGGLRLRRAAQEAPEALSIIIYRGAGGELGLGSEGALALRAPGWPALRVGGAWFSHEGGAVELRRGASARLSPRRRGAAVLEATTPTASLEVGVLAWEGAPGLGAGQRSQESFLPVVSYEARAPLLEGVWGDVRASGVYAPREGEADAGARLSLEAGAGWERAWGAGLSSRARVSSRSTAELGERPVELEATGNQTPRQERRAAAQQRSAVTLGGGLEACARGPSSQRWRHRACGEVAGFATPLDENFGQRVSLATAPLGLWVPRYALHARLGQDLGGWASLDLGGLWVGGLRGDAGWSAEPGWEEGFARLGGRLRLRLGEAAALLGDAELGPQEGWGLLQGRGRVEVSGGGVSLGLGVLRRGSGLRLARDASLSQEEGPSFLANPTGRALSGWEARLRAPLWPGGALGLESSALVPWEARGRDVGWVDGRLGVFWGDEGWRLGVEAWRRVAPEGTDVMFLARSSRW